MTRWQLSKTRIFSMRKNSGFLLAVFCLVFAISFTTVVVRGMANDIWWDLVVGHWQVVHHAVMTQNLLTVHDFGKTFMNTEWFWADIAYFFSLWGYPGLVVMTSLGILAWYAALWAFATWLGSSRLVQVAILLMGCGASVGWWDFRPQVWAYPVAVLMVWWVASIGWRVRAVGWLDFLVRSWWEPVCLSVVVMAWAQIHGSWILILGWLMVELIASVRWSDRIVYAVWAALILSWVGWANPWGGLYPIHSLGTASSGIISSSLGEWFSPNFHALWLLALVAVYFFGGAMLFLKGPRQADRRPSLVSWLYFIGFGLGALYGSRFLPYLALGFAFALSGIRVRVSVSRFVRRLFTVLLSLAAMGLFLLGLRALPVGPVTSVQAAGSWEPLAAVNYLRTHHVSQVFAMDRWGGFLEYEGFRPWIDGRADFWLSVGSAFQRYGWVRFGYRSPVGLLASAGESWALVAPQSSFAWGLEQAGWRVRFRDPGTVYGSGAVVLQRVSASRRISH